MELYIDSPTPKIGSMDFELGMANSFFTDPIDDLSMLVAASTSSTCLEDTANTDVVSSSQFDWFAQKRGALGIDSAETPLDYGRTSSKRAKLNSWNISFGHPHSYAESTPSTWDRTRKRSSVNKQMQQVLADEAILAYVKTEFDQNVESNQTLMYVSDTGNLQASAKKGNSLPLVSKKCPDSSVSPTLKEEPFYHNHKCEKDIYTLSTNEAHTMAERRRREKLNQKFIALSKIVPGLKKADKATILADAVSYVKRLEEQLKALEDQVPKSVSFAGLKKSDEGSYNHPQSLGHEKDLQQPDIEARVVGKNVLIHVHCGKTESVLVKALEELENLHLSVVNANVLSFSNKAIDLTFTAQIEEDCKLTADDMVKALHIFFRGLN